MLPYLVKLVGIPLTSGVRADTLNTQSVLLSDYLIFPFQRYHHYPESPPPFEMDTTFYSTDVFYPSEITTTGAPAIWRGIRIIEGGVMPITCNPARREIRVYPQIVINFSYEGIDPHNALTDNPRRPPSELEPIFRRMIINYDFLPLCEPEWDKKGYLIIAADDYYDQVRLLPYHHSRLGFWKRKKGFVVRVINQNHIINVPGNENHERDTAAIRDTIREIYNTYIVAEDVPGDTAELYYVLLVGDAPVREQYGEPGDQRGTSRLIPIYASREWWSSSPVSPWQYNFSDYYYALLEGSDDYPEVAIGRLSVEDTSQVTPILNKIYDYERNVSSNWSPDHALLVAHEVDYLGHVFCDDKDTIRADILEPFPFGVTTAYGDSEEVSNQTVINAINASTGLGIVNYRGHGMPTYWEEWNYYEENFTNGDIYTLQNTERFPLVFNLCCLTGHIVDPDSDAMVEVWTRYAGGGSVGALGASARSYIPADSTMDYVLFGDLFGFEADIGWAINSAKVEAIAAHPEHDSAGLSNARAYNWIGDPELSVWEETPRTRQITHPVLIETGPYHFCVQVLYADGSPVPLARVCIYKIGEFHRIGYTNEDGYISFDIYCSSNGLIHVTVTKQDRYGYPNYVRNSQPIFPYEGTCTVYRDITSRTSISETPKRIIPWTLSENQPNPFDSKTIIRYSVAKLAHISLKVYNASGQLVKTLIEEDKEPRYYTTLWNGKDDAGKKLPAGIYFYRMETEDFTKTHKALLLR